MYKDPLLKARTGVALTLLSMIPMFFSFIYCVVKHLGYWKEKKRRKKERKERKKSAFDSRENIRKERNVRKDERDRATERSFLLIFSFERKERAVAFDRSRSLDHRASSLRLRCPRKYSSF